MNSGRAIGGLVLILVGLSALFDVNIWRFVWPVFIIFIGLRMFGGNDSRSHKNWSGVGEHKQTTSEKTIEDVVVFNGLKKKIETDRFSGGKVTAVFGGCEIDLTKASIPEKGDAKLEVNSIFGGIKIIVPKNWAVQTSVVGILGAFHNGTTTPSQKEEKGRLFIKGSAVFGGGDIINP